MKTIGDFVRENNLTVDVRKSRRWYECVIRGRDGEFTFRMTKEKLIEHIRRFSSKEFVDTILSNEKMVTTHFMRLAVTWWHIQVTAVNLSKEITIE